MTAFSPKLGRRIGRKKLYINKKYAKSRRERKIVLAGYGNKCACCGETTPQFLTIDHVNNDGHKDRGRGFKLFARIIRQGFPADYRILCFNCNCGRELNGGICPHQGVLLNGPPQRNGAVGITFATSPVFPLLEPVP